MSNKHHQQRMAEIQGGPGEPFSDPKPTPTPPPPSQRLLFLYTEAADLSPVDLELLRQSGFIPIRCASFDAIKVIDPLVAGERSAIFAAAIQAIHQHAPSGEGPKTLFGKAVAAHFFNDPPAAAVK